MPTDYRRDIRTEKKFAKDVKGGNRREDIIASHMVEVLQHKKESKFHKIEVRFPPGRNKIFKDNYRDKGDCKFIGTYNHADPLYSVDFSKIIDIKHLNIIKDKFCFKYQEIENCIRKSFPVLYVSRLSSSDPVLRWFDIAELEELFKRPHSKLPEFKYERSGWRLFEADYDDWIDYDTLEPIDKFDEMMKRALGLEE